MHQGLPRIPVVIRSADPALVGAVDEALRHLCVEQLPDVGPDAGPDGVPGAPTARVPVLTFEAAEPVLPSGAAVAVRMDTGHCVWQAGRDFVYGDAAALIRIVPGTGEARGHVSPRLLADALALNGHVFSLAAVALLILLRDRGLHALHAAALARGGEGVLFAADSDSGKSTAAYSLVRQGWHYVSDDSVLLRADGPRVDVLPFRRHFGLDPEAQRLFPELSGGWAAQLVDPHKWSIPVDELYPGQASEGCTPRLLVFPRIVARPESRFVPVGQAEALRLLLVQSPLGLIEPAHALRHLELLKRLVAQTRHVRLDAGRDLLADPSRLASMIDALLKAPEAQREPVPSPSHAE